MVSKRDRSPVASISPSISVTSSAHAAQRVGHLVAAAHDVADLHRRDLQIEHLHLRRGRRVEPVRLDVRVGDRLQVAACSARRRRPPRAAISKRARRAPRGRVHDERRGVVLAFGCQRERRLGRLGGPARRQPQPQRAAAPAGRDSSSRGRRRAACSARAERHDQQPRVEADGDGRHDVDVAAQLAAHAIARCGTAPAATGRRPRAADLERHVGREQRRRRTASPVGAPAGQ